MLEPVLTYRIELPPDCDVHQMLGKLRQLEEEIPELHIVWNERLAEIHAQVMGEVQIEILKSLIHERFGEWGGIRSRKYCIQRDDPQYRGGCRPFRAAAPLCGSSFAAGAGRTGQRTADWNRLQRGHPGPQLAASDPHTSAGAEDPGVLTGRRLPI